MASRGLVHWGAWNSSSEECGIYHQQGARTRSKRSSRECGIYHQQGARTRSNRSSRECGIYHQQGARTRSNRSSEDVVFTTNNSKVAHDTTMGPEGTLCIWWVARPIWYLPYFFLWTLKHCKKVFFQRHIWWTVTMCPFHYLLLKKDGVTLRLLSCTERCALTESCKEPSAEYFFPSLLSIIKCK